MNRKKTSTSDGSDTTVSSVIKKALSSDSTWDDKEAFLDVIYWIRQVFAVFNGIAWGIIPLHGILGIAFLLGVLENDVVYVTKGLLLPALLSVEDIRNISMQKEQKKEVEALKENSLISQKEEELKSKKRKLAIKIELSETAVSFAEKTIIEGNNDLKKYISKQLPWLERN